MADRSDDRDEDDRDDDPVLRRAPIAPRPLEPASLTIPIAPPKPDKKLDKDKDDAARFVGRLGKKQKKLKKDAVRRLDSWERYRALTDAVDEANDLVDLADHKARFALVIMAAVNVVLFFTADALDPLKSGSFAMQIVLGLYLFIYVLIALYFFLQAIESLRPRQSKPQVNPPADQPGYEEMPLGIRFYEDVLRRDADQYRKAWQEVRIGQLNAELAVQAHALAGINKAKFGALRRLYKGLQIMLLMAVGLVALGGIFTVLGTAKKAAHENDRSKGSEVLGPFDRITHTGVKEPSGIAFHPGLGHFFVVGDDGKLAELDAEGRNLRTLPVEKQLEDVAFYPPSNLLLVSEKRAEVILFDPASSREIKRFKIDTAALLGGGPAVPNQGFEGLAFRPDPTRPGGGIVYLSHQRSPAAVVGVAFDPTTTTTIDAGTVVSNWSVKDATDLSAVAYVPSIDRVVAVADSKDRLLVLRDDGSVQDEIPIPGQQQEGLAFDDQGSMWIADDKDKCVLKVKGALGALETRVRAEDKPAASGVPSVSTPIDLLEKKKKKLLK